MTTRSGSDETMMSPDEVADDSPKIVSLPPVTEDSVGEISPKKQVNSSSPLAFVSAKDEETNHSDSVEVSSSEMNSMFPKEPESAKCPGVISIPETDSAFLEENRVCEEIEESEVSKEGDRFGDDGSVISISETKGFVLETKEQDSEVQRLLEAEKRRLLAEIEAGAIFKKKDDVGTLAMESEFEIKDQDSESQRLLDAEKRISLAEIEAGSKDDVGMLAMESEFENTEQDSEIQRLLDAEKRRLLAEIEAGAIFKEKEDVGKLAVVSEFQKIEKNGNEREKVRVKDNAFVGGSVKIELVDDTALLNVVPFHKKGKDHPKRAGATHSDKEAPRKHKKTGGGKQDVGKSECQSRGDTNGKITYSINQMKSMRYVRVANQKKLWSDMYGKLLPELVTEYEGLVSLKNQKASKSNQSGIGILGTEERIDDLTLEEEEEEYTEDNDDYNSILRPAFEVDGEPDFDSGPPEDGLEYLRRVRWEAKRIPNVRVAKIDETTYVKKEQSVYMPQIPEIPKCPEHLLPVKEWEDTLLSDFLNLRVALSQEEEMMSTCQPVEDSLIEIFNKRLQTERDESFGVVVSEIQGMDSVTRVTKLKRRICLVEKESGLESNDCKWLVALCASVDTPLDADTCACIRALLRKCASLRAVEVEDEQVINMANMLITIAGRYFGQME